MIRYLSHIFLLLFFLPAFSSCKSQEKAPSASINETKKKEKKEIESNTAIFIEALKEKTNGNYEEAAQLFKKAVEMDSTDAASYYELAQLNVLLDNPSEAVRFAEKAYKLDPANEWYAKRLGEFYKRTGNIEQSIRIYETLLNEDPENIDYLFELAAQYVMAGEYKKSIDMLNRMEDMIGVTEEISLQKQKLYQQTGQKDKEIEEIQKLITNFPQETRYYAMLAELYMGRKMEEKALEAYEKILEIDPDDPYIHISLSDYYRKNNQPEKAYAELKKGFANPQLNVETKVQILLAYYTVAELYSEKKDQASELANVLIETHPEDPQAYSVYADFLYQQEKYEEAREAYRKILQFDSSKYAVWQQLLFIESELADFEAMKTESEKAIELFPQQPLLYLFSGVADFQLENYESTIKKLKRGSNFIVGNDGMLSQFYANIGDAYNELKEFEKSDEYYEKALDLEPLNALVLNNYAYYLSLRNKDLPKAKEMAEKAVELDSANSANLDTYAWILYKMNDYIEAEKWIKKAMEHGGDQDDTILEHYGDILYKLGQNDEAYQYWLKAREKGKGSEFLDKKIRDKKLYE